MLLTAALFAPLAGAVLVAAVPASRAALVRWLALAASLVALALAVAVAVRFRAGEGGFQLGVAADWVPSFGVRYRVGVDGVSLPLVLLTTVLTPLAIVVGIIAQRTSIQAQQRGGTAETDKVQPVNSGPNPYRVIRDWAQLTLEKRPWGGSNGVAIDRDGKSVWATDRCSPGIAPGCLGTKANPVHLFDETGKEIRSFGGGMFVWPHGIHVDRDGNVWVTDARAPSPASSTRPTISRCRAMRARRSVPPSRSRTARARAGSGLSHARYRGRDWWLSGVDERDRRTGLPGRN